MTLGFDPSGRWLAGALGGAGPQSVILWDLKAPASAEPVVLPRTDTGAAFGRPVFHPSKPWLSMTVQGSLSFWPLPRRSPWIILQDAINANIGDLVFTPDDRWLVAMGGGAGVTAWPLEGQNNGSPRVLLDRPATSKFGVHPSGDRVAVRTTGGTVVLVPLDGGPAQDLPGVLEGQDPKLAFSPDARYLAGVPWGGVPEEMVLTVWDLESGEVRSLGTVPGMTSFLGFDDDRRLRWSGWIDASSLSGIGENRIYDVENGAVEVLPARQGTEYFRAVGPDRDFMIFGEGSLWGEMDLFRIEIETGEKHRITTHGDPAHLRDLEIDPSGRWMVSGGRRDTIVRVGSVTGEEPHLLFDAQGDVRAVAFSHDGRWLASAGEGSALCIWPMPNMTEPPLHTLPLDELLARLHAATNLRVVEDPDSPKGWKLEIGPFPGWEEVPEW